MAPKRGLRGTFFLGFHKKPHPAAYVYRQDVIDGGIPKNGLTVGSTVNIRPGRQRTTTSVVVLDVGTKVMLDRLKVDSKGAVYKPGDVLPPDVVGTPHYEKQKEKANSLEALRERHLQLVAQGIASEDQTPVVPPKAVVKRLPKRLKTDEMVALQNKLDNLPCFSQQPGDIPLLTGSTVYLNGGSLNFLKGDLAGNPTSLFRKILDLCLGDLAGDPGLCATASGAKQRGKVMVKASISEGAYGYCTLNCCVSCDFEPSYVLRTYLTKRQGQLKSGYSSLIFIS
ncbi:hypothetical protein FOCC_FOCC011021 [Frankliniella occidentalis]|uniref:Uncharacterized protein LOC113216453 n=1 Tax=Frankliniella occidentalis TaxID=133901 RepID=A0A9C6WZU3_FRAOC|nr:uncharacterized protein LOC113216453 [Frankliniella occidentalis]KAE8743369.1 hypothetical protein FOCC_FOCC011021 [Frankliniella occidentalis]